MRLFRFGSVVGFALAASLALETAAFAQPKEQKKESLQETRDALERMKQAMNEMSKSMSSLNTEIRFTLVTMMEDSIANELKGRRRDPKLITKAEELARKYPMHTKLLQEILDAITNYSGSYAHTAIAKHYSEPTPISRGEGGMTGVTPDGAGYCVSGGASIGAPND